MFETAAAADGGGTAGVAASAGAGGLRRGPRTRWLAWRRSRPLLERIGIEATAGPRGSRSTPSPAAARSEGRWRPFLSELLERHAEGEIDAADTEAAAREVLDMMSCKAAVKAGDRLRPQEIADASGDAGSDRSRCELPSWTTDAPSDPDRGARRRIRSLTSSAADPQPPEIGGSTSITATDAGISRYPTAITS